MTGQPEGVDKVEGSAICSLVENTDEEIFASFSEIGNFLVYVNKDNIFLSSDVQQIKLKRCRVKSNICI